MNLLDDILNKFINLQIEIEDNITEVQLIFEILSGRKKEEKIKLKVCKRNSGSIIKIINGDKDSDLKLFQDIIDENKNELTEIVKQSNFLKDIKQYKTQHEQKRSIATNTLSKDPINLSKGVHNTKSIDLSTTRKRSPFSSDESFQEEDNKKPLCRLPDLVINFESDEGYVVDNGTTDDPPSPSQNSPTLLKNIKKEIPEILEKNFSGRLQNNTSIKQEPQETGKQINQRKRSAFSHITHPNVSDKKIKIDSSEENKGCKEEDKSICKVNYLYQGSNSNDESNESDEEELLDIPSSSYLSSEMTKNEQPKRNKSENSSQYDNTDLWRSIREGDVINLKRVLEQVKQKSININGHNYQKNHETPLILAVELAAKEKNNKKRFEIVKIILEQEGLDINKEDKYGRTALSYALEDRNNKLINILLNKKADLLHKSEKKYDAYRYVFYSLYSNNWYIDKNITDETLKRLYSILKNSKEFEAEQNNKAIGDGKDRSSLLKFIFLYYVKFKEFLWGKTIQECIDLYEKVFSSRSCMPSKKIKNSDEFIYLYLANECSKSFSNKTNFLSNGYRSIIQTLESMNIIQIKGKKNLTENNIKKIGELQVGINGLQHFSNEVS